MKEQLSSPSSGHLDITRRQFLARAGTAAAGFTIIAPHLVRGAGANSKIDLGIIGCGGRGRWIADLFAKSGKFNCVAAMDYFKDRTAAYKKTEVTWADMIKANEKWAFDTNGLKA